MNHSNRFQYRHSLECLRLAADCRNLAQNVDTLGLKTHFLRMADRWSSLADQTQGASKISSNAISLQRMN